MFKGRGGRGKRGYGVKPSGNCTKFVKFIPNINIFDLLKRSILLIGYNSFTHSTGPPDKIAEMGTFLHACEGDMVCLSTNKKIPYFNATIYLENKQSIGKVDEILGPMNEVYFTVKLQEGIVASSFKPNDKVYIGEDKLLPLERFLPKPPAPKIKAEKGQWKGSN
ncbi:32599_t:CDS:2, partial [Racocetra persica]